LGYQRALADYNLPTDDTLIIESDLSVEAGFQAVQTLLAGAERPDGIFVANDFCAAGCMTALKQTGVTVPREIAVVGFNDDPVAQVIEPSLTTVHYAGETMGEIAMRSLISLLHGVHDGQINRQIVLNSELVIRDSSVRKP
jgi:LacI family transcriptional regulator